MATILAGAVACAGGISAAAAVGTAGAAVSAGVITAATTAGTAFTAMGPAGPILLKVGCSTALRKAVPAIMARKKRQSQVSIRNFRMFILEQCALHLNRIE